jgi:DNA polymerase-3 subunit epsilon
MPDGHTQSGGVVTYCNPGVPIPEGARAVHGITDEMVESEPKTAEVVRRLLECLRGIHALGWPLLIYNAPYDWPLLHAEAERTGVDLEEIPPLPLIDPLVLDRGYDRFRKGSRKLADTARHYGVELADAHDAFADAAAAAGLLRALVRRYPELQQMSFAALQDVQRDMYRAWTESFNEYRAKRGQEPIEEIEWPGLGRAIEEKAEAVQMDLVIA